MLAEYTDITCSRNDSGWNFPVVLPKSISTAIRIFSLVSYRWRGVNTLVFFSLLFFSAYF